MTLPAQRNLTNYLQQYINFRLKVEDAVASGYDTVQNRSKRNLNGYRNELASKLPYQIMICKRETSATGI